MISTSGYLSLCGKLEAMLEDAKKITPQINAMIIYRMFPPSFVYHLFVEL
jgi:hypothetical protein